MCQLEQKNKKLEVARPFDLGFGTLERVFVIWIRKIPARVIDQQWEVEIETATM